MNIRQCVVDNRVFLLGLDNLYRDAMKAHERTELLTCATETAQTLNVRPADVPIEGYYSEDEQLTAYFRLMRALQGVHQKRESEVAGHHGFQRLKQVTQSGLFGPADDNGLLLATGRDPLSIALERTFPHWGIEHLVEAAYQVATGSDDFSLVASAALARDTVALAAVRETVVLYAAFAGGSGGSQPRYVWQVEAAIEKRATQFVETFNCLFKDSLPPQTDDWWDLHRLSGSSEENAPHRWWASRLPSPTEENAADYWNACRPWEIVGRCVRLGFDNRVLPHPQYHWAIDGASDSLRVTDFWDTEIWTTERYKQDRGYR